MKSIDLDEIRRKRDELWLSVMDEAALVRKHEERVQDEATPEGKDFLLFLELNRLEVAVMRLRAALGLVLQLSGKIDRVENSTVRKAADEWLRETNPRARKKGGRK